MHWMASEIVRGETTRTMAATVKAARGVCKIEGRGAVRPLLPYHAIVPAHYDVDEPFWGADS
jgi:hypothetical protein